MESSFSTSEEKPTEQLKPQQGGMEKFLSVSKLLQRIGINDTCSDPNCNHLEGCLYNAINASVKGLALGYAAKSSLSLIGVLFSYKKLLKNPSIFFGALFNKQTLRFSAFPALYNLILHATQCGMRKGSVKITPGMQSFISGFLAAFVSLATRQPQNRSLWGVFLLARAFDCFYRSLCNKGILKHRGVNYTMMFSFCYILLGVNYALEPLNLPPSFNKYIRNFSAETVEDLAFRRCWVELRNNTLAKKGIPAMEITKALILNKKK